MKRKRQRKEDNLLSINTQYKISRIFVYSLFFRVHVQCQYFTVNALQPMTNYTRDIVALQSHASIYGGELIQRLGRSFKDVFTTKDPTGKIVMNYTVILSILNFNVPAGTDTSAISPTTFPNKPFPIGEVTEILPSFKLASFSETI